LIRPTLLLIDDALPLAVLYKDFLKNEDIQIDHVSTGAEALNFLKNKTPSVIVLDMMLPDMSGMDILKHINEKAYETTIIVVTAFGSIEIAVEAMRYGAFEFLSKPFDKSRFLITIHNALERSHLKDVVKSYKKFYHEEFHGMIGSSLPMQAIYKTIENVAASKATVFITGESGTGKELCATAVHDLSPRKDKNLVVINCGAIPENLMESEIFGHVKGAFTGAIASREGAAQKADGGTLFLDELGELDLDLQTKLLRLIQSGTFQAVGSTETRKVDIRFICATNRDPLNMVKKGTFREDLYYRLNVIPIHMPPLRERGDDSLVIAKILLEHSSREENKNFTDLSSDVKRLILFHEWPGNIRQLENMIRNVVVLNDAQEVTLEMLPKPFNEIDMATDKYDIHLILADEKRLVKAQNRLVSRLISEETQEDISGEYVIVPLWVKEKEIIEKAVNSCHGNIPEAAKLLEINASTIYRKIKLWKIKKGLI
jgi:two-component system repressor protein LuxO